MITRLLLAGSLALALAGCVTVANTLPPDQLAGMRLAGVTVRYAPAARIWWGDGERAYAATRGVAAHDSDTVANTPEGQAYLRSAIAAKVRDAMTRHLAGELTGSRPVRLEVAVTGVQIASAMQRILVGGGHMMSADVTLVDARTGQVLVAYPAQTAAAGAGSGLLGTMVEHAALAEPIDRVVDNFASQYSRWLMRR
jgi:hypothetical protein